MSENGMIRLGGMWKQEKDGKTYLAGNLSATARLLLFKNENKNGQNDPDWILFLAPKQPKPAQTQPQQSKDDYM